MTLALNKELAKRAVVLLRASSKQQTDREHDFDIPQQKSILLPFVESKGWDLVKVFTEGGVSGFKVSANDRDAIQDIKKMADRREFDILVIYMSDRLGRIADETPLIVSYLNQRGITVFSYTEGEISAKDHTSKLITYIRYWQAEGESRKTSQRVSDAIVQAVSESEWVAINGREVEDMIGSGVTVHYCADNNVFDIALLKEATNVDASDNIFSKWFLVNMNGASADGKTPGLYTYITESSATGEEFVTVLGNSQVNSSSNTYFELQIMREITYNGGSAQYIVFDFDAARLAEGTFPFMVVPRNVSGSGMWGGSTPSFDVLAPASLGNFQHITCVFDIANNAAYYYVNNSLVYENTTNGWTSEANFASFMTATKWNFNGFQFGSNATGALALDNTYVRHLTGDAATALQSALSDGDIADWTDNVYSYALPEI